MKVCENGKIREMTAEEIKALESIVIPEIQETMEDRLAKLEKSFSKIAELLEKLGVK